MLKDIAEIGNTQKIIGNDGPHIQSSEEAEAITYCLSR